MKKNFTLFLALFSLSTIAQNGLNLDGVNDYVLSPVGGPTGTGNRTVECWIKTSTNIATQQVILDYGVMTPNGSRFTLNLVDFGKLRIEVGGNGFNSTQSLADGNWHHVAVTYDHAATTKFRMYIDGVLAATQNTTVAVNTLAGGFNFGRRNDGINLFNGTIDEVRVWNVARTQAQIQANMNNELCALPAGLVAYYKLNQGIAGGTNATVTSAINELGTNNGTLTGFALTGASSNWVVGKSLASGTTAPGNATIVACDSYTAQTGAVWTTSGNYTDTLSGSGGCDSILNIALTINNSNTGNLTTTGCNLFVSPSGNYTWSTSGTYTDTLTNAQGCDSVLTINLTIQTVDTQVIQNGIVLSALATGAAYQWLDCNNGFAPISGATSQAFVPTINGTYAVEVTINGCADTSTCYTVANIGIAEAQANYFVVYPNPTNGIFIIKPLQTISEGTISMYTTTGKLVYSAAIAGEAEMVISPNVGAGVYLVKLTSNQGVQTMRLVVQ